MFVVIKMLNFLMLLFMRSLKDALLLICFIAILMIVCIIILPIPMKLFCVCMVLLMVTPFIKANLRNTTFRDLCSLDYDRVADRLERLGFNHNVDTDGKSKNHNEWWTGDLLSHPCSVRINTNKNTYKFIWQGISIIKFIELVKTVSDDRILRINIVDQFVMSSNLLQLCKDYGVSIFEVHDALKEYIDNNNMENIKKYLYILEDVVCEFTHDDVEDDVEFKFTFESGKMRLFVSNGIIEDSNL